MPSPGELKKIQKRVAEAAADLLSREGNDALSAEDLAEELASTVVEEVISAYEDIQAKSYNLVVLGHFRLSETESYTAAVGPLSTRASARARGVGERFAWDYKTRKGTGKFTLVPLIRNPNEAWDEARMAELTEYTSQLGSPVPGVEASYDPMRFTLTPEILGEITPDWAPDEDFLKRKYGPACRCGRRTEVWHAEGGGVDDGVCPRHPEGREGDS